MIDLRFHKRACYNQQSNCQLFHLWLLYLADSSHISAIYITLYHYLICIFCALCGTYYDENYYAELCKLWATANASYNLLNVVL